MRNMTSTLLVLCPEFLTTRLKQSIFNPLQPLLFNDIISSPGLRRDYVSQQLSTYFIATAIRKLHSQAVEHVFDTEPDLFPTVPKLNLLSPKKTSLHQLGAIFHDKGTIEGIYSVHQDIWIHKLGLKEDDESGDFTQRLWLA